MKDKFNVEAQILPEENEVEMWLPAPGYEDKYEISSFGRLRNAETQRLRKLCLDKCGYPVVSLRKYDSNGVYKVFCVYIHRLVCEAFNGAPTEETPVCDHKDHCIVNNYYKNLHFVSHSENSLNLKSKNKKQKISTTDTPIVLMDLNGNFVRRFDSIKQASKLLGLSLTQIQHNVRGVRKPFKDGYFITEERYNASFDKEKKI